MWILITLLALAAGALYLARKTQGMPDVFTVRRSAVIQAPPEAILPLIYDFHRWTAWSPYEEYDPAMKRTYSGADAGVGAIYDWTGNGKVGSGRMEIVELVPLSKVAIRLDFNRPFEAHNTAEFVLAPQGGGTHVTWAMRGASPPMHKVMSLFMNMDQMIGKDFEKGLSKLKAAVEG